MDSSHTDLRLPLVFVCAITFLLYLPSLSYDFLGIDDPRYITENKLVVAPDLSAILSPDTLVESDWTPLVTLSHALEYKLFGMWAPGFRAVQMALHLVTLLLLYKLFIGLEVAPLAALFTVLIWGVHPLNIESVAWLASRKNVLALLFGVLFLRAVLQRRWLWALFHLVFALLSKGTSVLFPPLGLALFLFSEKRMERGALKTAALWFSLYSVLAVCRVLISLDAQLEVIAQRGVGSYSFLDRMSVMGRVFWRQTGQFFWPADLALLYGWQKVSWEEMRVWGAWGALAVLVAALVWYGRHDREARIGGAFFLFGLLPTFNLTPAPLFQADRYFHTASIGLSLLAVVLVGRLISNARLSATFLTAFAALILLPFSMWRLETWRTTESVWRRVTEQYPRFAPGWVSLGDTLKVRGDFHGAEISYQRAIDLEPGSTIPRVALQELRERGSR